jgi:hypothetical protein
MYAPPVNGPIISVGKSRRMGLAGHAARIGEGGTEVLRGFSRGNLSKTGRLKCLGVDGITIF